MPTSQLSQAVRQLRRVVLKRDDTELTDGQLLSRFLENRGESAFEALVRRHGAMVWGVCRRTLGHHHDAEDAFQAAFLVLVRKAASIMPRDRIASWLYGVAHHTAIKARALGVRRRAREKQVTAMPEREAVTRDIRDDLQPRLDQELNRLPDHYRLPIILCDLEGKSHKEAARQLGWPVGTVSGRLVRARQRLARRLSRSGSILSVGVLAALLSQSAASAAVPTTVVASTVKAAGLLAAGQATAGLISVKVIALMEGVLKAMLLTKLKVVAVVLLAIGLLGVGAGLLRQDALAEKPIAQAPKDAAPKDRTEVTGKVQAVDPAKHTITIVGDGKKEPFVQKTYEVAPDAKVFLDDGTGDKTGFHEGRLADVTEGAPVSLRLSSEQKVIRLYVDGPSIQGILKSVNATAGTVTVAVTVGKTDPPVDKTYSVIPNVRVSIDDGTAKKAKPASHSLADLPAGSVVTLKLSGDQKVAGSIRAEGQTVRGVLKAVDAAKNTLTLAGKEGDNTYEAAKEVQVHFQDAKLSKTPPKGGQLTDLKTGAMVTLRLSLDRKTVVSVQVEAKTVEGSLKGTDAAKNTITVTVHPKGGEPGDHTFEVAKDAAITIDAGKEAKLADLPADARVSVRLSADQKTAAVIHVEGPSVAGVVKGTAGNGTIIINNKIGEENYAVGQDVAIVIDGGKPGKLTDLIDGTQVTARLSADKRQLIGTINAAGPSFHGPVKSVDPTGNTITLHVGGKNGVGGEDKTFNVTKNTAVVTEINGVPLKLDDVRVDKEVVLRLFVDQKAAAKIVVQGQ